MAEENPDELQTDRTKQEESRADKWQKKIKNHPVVAALIVIGSLVLTLLIYANKFHDEWAKTSTWLPAKNTAPAPFAARIDFMLQVDVPIFYLVESSHVCSAPIAVNLSFTNLQPFTATILDYRVEAQDVDDRWVKLPRITVNPYQRIYVTTPQMGLEHAVIVDTIDPAPLDTQLTSTSALQPHVPLTGMAFFDYPFPHTFTDVRVIVEDTLGNRFTSDSLRVRPTTLHTGLRISLSTHKRLDLKKLFLSNHCGR